MRGGTAAEQTHEDPSMRMKFFTIPTFGGETAAEELDRFLAAHRIIALDREFIQDGQGSAWAICVRYHASNGSSISPRRGTKIDYREVLNEREFEVFARLRELRKRLAEKEGVPAYSVFNNEQLATMVTQLIGSRAALAAMPGVGMARAEKFGEPFLAVLAEFSATKERSTAKDQPDAAV